MADATLEPRVVYDDFSLDYHVKQLRSWSLTDAASDDARRRDRDAHKAADMIESLRATIASQAEALAAKQMLINMLKIDVAKLDKAIAERDTAEAALKAAREALRLLVSDVQDYEAWQRPCHALDVARAVLAGEPTP